MGSKSGLGTTILQSIYFQSTRILKKGFSLGFPLRNLGFTIRLEGLKKLSSKTSTEDDSELAVRGLFCGVSCSAIPPPSSASSFVEATSDEGETLIWRGCKTGFRICTRTCLERSRNPAAGFLLLLQDLLQIPRVFLNPAAEGLFASISFAAYAKQQAQKKAELRAYRTWKNEKIGSEVAEHEKWKKRNYIDRELEKLLAIVLYIYAKNQTSYAALSLTSNHLPATVVLIPQMIHYEYQIRQYNKIQRLHLPVQGASQTLPRARSYLGDGENSPLRQDSEANHPSSFSTDPIVAGEALKV
nr:hypothetical protein Iba_chr01cCG11660 [Ipomoea batatas]